MCAVCEGPTGIVGGVEAPEDGRPPLLRLFVNCAPDVPKEDVNVHAALRRGLPRTHVLALELRNLGSCTVGLPSQLVKALQVAALRACVPHSTQGTQR
jgi:hypothetical protein